MLGAIYLALIPLLAYVTGNKDSIRVLVGLCGVILADLIITDYLTLTDNFFFHRGLADLLMLLIVYKSALIGTKRTIVSLCIFTSLLINIYLCFELGNVFVYQYWEVINLILCEIIFLTLIISDRGWKMFTGFKAYIYGALAAVGLFLVGVMKYLSSKNKSLEKELAIEKKNVVVLEKVQTDRKELDKAVDQVKAEAQVVERENNEKRNNKVRPAIGSKFGDRRL